MFEVRWADEALEDLARLWREGDSKFQHSLTLAANSLESRLQTDPLAEGESRTQDERIAFEFPLGIRFIVDQPNSVVRVIYVWSYERNH